MIKYWIKIVNLNENSLVKSAYIVIKNDAERNISYNGNNWAFQIKELLNKIGMANVWFQQNEIEISYYHIKQRIIDLYHQTWYTEINNSSRLSTYSLFKHTFECEKYLDYISEDKYRIAYARFRCSSHDLLVETGRYTNIPRNERICKNCTMNVIDNEYHLLLTCPKYSALRKEYIKRYYIQWPTLQKFENLMCLKSRKTIQNIAKYIYSAMKLHIN